ncbi:cysteine desulfurase [Patescibacteria group bacterium]|nr:cysteine desulfurase [Patescibacteria group bacterium]MCG2694486.1 cysteine desulfurase [Candidatus Parcubacteria bacterium]
MFNLKNLSKKGEQRKRIFLDHATSTPVRKEVLEAMQPYWNEKYGNPGTIHQFGMEAKKTLDDSRKKVAQVLKCHSDEIIFTASGTESNSLAIFGVLEKMREEKVDLKDLHIITTVMEHPSILNWFEKYEKEGVQVSYIGIDEEGIIDLKKFREELKPNTVFVSVMYANNEIGTIQPISKIAHILRTHRKNNHLETRFPSGGFPVFHTDASQAPLYLPLDIHSLGVDMLTIDGQKIYGPKGVGALFKKREAEIIPLMIGGSQEGGLRAGTENIPLIVGLAKSLELADKDREKESARLLKIRNHFIDRVLKEIPGAVLNGSREKRMPNNVNISIPGIDSEFMIIKLDNKGIACSSKSACMGRIQKASYVVECLGNSLGNSLRFTLGKSTTKKDVDYTVEMIKRSI